jgi:hypothetical protein
LSSITVIIHLSATETATTMGRKKRGNVAVGDPPQPPQLQQPQPNGNITNNNSKRSKQSSSSSTQQQQQSLQHPHSLPETGETYSQIHGEQVLVRTFRKS